MTNYFIAKMEISDMEEFHTTETIIHRLKNAIDIVLNQCEGLRVEDIIVSRVIREEYEKEDQNGKI